jgi:hypothetical protein
MQTVLHVTSLLVLSVLPRASGVEKNSVSELDSTFNETSPKVEWKFDAQG